MNGSTISDAADYSLLMTNDGEAGCTLSMRELFAGLALAGVLASGEHFKSSQIVGYVNSLIEELAKDAEIRGREKT